MRAHGDKAPWAPLTVATHRCTIGVVEMPDTLEGPPFEFRMSRLAAMLEAARAPELPQVNRSEFGPGAKIPQKRLQEQIFMKNEEFLGAPWALKWSQNRRKIHINIVTIFLPM